MIKLKNILKEIVGGKIPPRLYHATFSSLVNRISKNGLVPGGTSFGSGKTNFSESDRRFIYLAPNPRIAKEIVQSSLSDPKMRVFRNDEINVLTIDVRGLDPKKFQVDPSSWAFGTTALMYGGIIPPANIVDYGD